jgi:hypothetical protein
MSVHVLWRPLALVVCFAYPFLAAFYNLKSPNSLKFHHHGDLYPFFVTEALSTEKDFQLIFFMPADCDARCLLWKEQWEPLKKLVGAINKDVQFCMMDAHDHENYLIGLQDKHGISILGYEKRHNPQKAFIDLKKILKR